VGCAATGFGPLFLSCNRSIYIIYYCGRQTIEEGALMRLLAIFDSSFAEAAVRCALAAGMALVALGTAHAMAETAKTDAAVPRTTPYPGGTWEPGPSQYGATVVDNVPIKMDDGIVLRASVAYPTDLASGQRAAGKFPVVIEHTPYVILAKPIVPNTYLTEHGYIYAVVRARGMGTSGGKVAFFSPREGMDGRAIINWAAHALDGADGRVALIGCSFPAGIAETDAAFAGPDSPLKAVIAACNGLDVVQRETWLVSGLTTTGFRSFTAYAPSLVGKTPAAIGFFGQVGSEIQAGGDAAYDRAFWRDRSPLRLARNIVDNGIPMLLWSGWRDILETGVMRAYTGLQNAYANRPLDAPMTSDQATTPRYQVIMGGWQHAEGLDAGIYLEWLDTWVRGVNTGIQNSSTPLHLYEGGSDRWVNLARYPVVNEYASWYLGAQDSLMTETPEEPGKAQPLLWGAPEQAGSKLTFMTPPLAKGATLAGPMSATIYASSSNTNLELIAKLFDVAADGTQVLITKGAVLGSQRELDRARSWTDRQGAIIWPWPKLQGDVDLQPGNVYQFEISLPGRVWGVNRGHRLALQLTTQTPRAICPEKGLPPENGTDPCGLTAPQSKTLPGGAYTILYGPETPSALHLPQLPWRAFQTAAAAVPPTAWSESERTLYTGSFTLPLDWGSVASPATPPVSKH
jgi:predicted acyl esterase